MRASLRSGPIGLLRLVRGACCSAKASRQAGQVRRAAAASRAGWARLASARRSPAAPRRVVGEELAGGRDGAGVHGCPAAREHRRRGRKARRTRRPRRRRRPSRDASAGTGRRVRRAGRAGTTPSTAAGTDPGAAAGAPHTPPGAARGLPERAAGRPGRGLPARTMVRRPTAASQAPGGAGTAAAGSAGAGAVSARSPGIPPRSGTCRRGPPDRFRRGLRARRCPPASRNRPTTARPGPARSSAR